MNETWKEFGDLNAYRISNSGEAQSRLARNGGKGKPKPFTEWKTLKQSAGKTDSYGGFYMVIAARIRGKVKTIRVHRLMAELFIREVKAGEQVNHIDGDRRNNSLSNLEIVSPKENIQNALKRGVFHKGQRALKGKISREMVMEIQKLISDGKMNKEIAKKFNIDPSNVSRIRHGSYRGLRYL
jgi:hypothetical protein